MPVCLALAMAVYFGRAYFPAVATYYQVRQQTRHFVHQAQPNARIAVSSFLKTVQAQTGAQIDPQSVRIKSAGGHIRLLQLDLRVPIQFPLLHVGRILTFAITQSPEQE